MGNKKRKKGSFTMTASTSMETPKQLKRPSSSITDSLTPKDIDIDAPRARRSRKQPTLYDPQTCAASVWQSDFQVEKALRGELDSDSDSSSSSTDGSRFDDDEEEGEGAKKEEDEVS